MEIIWNDEVAAFEDEYERLNERSTEAADRFAESLLNAVAQLEQFPEHGRVVPEHQNPRLREVFVGSWRLIYRLSADGLSLEVLVPKTFRLDA